MCSLPACPISGVFVSTFVCCFHRLFSFTIRYSQFCLFLKIRNPGILCLYMSHWLGELSWPETLIKVKGKTQCRCFCVCCVVFIVYLYSTLSLNNTTPTQHPEQHSVCCWDLQVSGIHNFLWLEVKLSHRHCLEESPAEAIFHTTAQEVYLPQKLLINLYTTITQSVLCTFITVWFDRPPNRTGASGTTLPPSTICTVSIVRKWTGIISVHPSQSHKQTV